MTAAPIHPATPDEWIRILAADAVDRAPAIHKASDDEFRRLCWRDTEATP